MTADASAAKTPRILRFVLVLGILNSTSPLAVDMYLPAFNTIGNELSSDIGQVQMTFSAFALASGLAPLIYGPLSDRFGRKMPILLGMVGFIASSIMCALVSNIGELLFWRAVQGATSAIGVLGMAVIRDVHRGNDALKIMSLMMLIQSVSPLLAPAIGSAVIEFTTWRWIFVILTMPGILAMAMVWGALPETLPSERRLAVRLKDVLPIYRKILAVPGFLIPASVGAAALAILHVWVASSSFLLIDLLRVGTLAYSIIFAVGAVSMILAAQGGAPLCRRFGTRTVLKWGSSFVAVFGVLIGALSIFATPPVILLLIGVWLMLIGVGLLMPTSAMLAMEPFETNLGAVSSMYNAFRNLAGSAAILVTGMAFDETARPALIMLAVCSVAAIVGASFLSSEDHAPSTVTEKA